jgi:hypothetical protein
MRETTGSYRWWWIAGGSLLLLLIAAVSVAWLCRTPLMARYYVYRLTRSEEGRQGPWLERLADLDEAVVAPLVDVMHREDERGCAGSKDALALLGKRWGLEDPRTGNLAELLADQFSGFSRSGQCQTLDLGAGWFRLAPSVAGGGSIRDACVRLVGEASRAPDPAVHAHALALGEVMLAKAPHAPALHACRQLTRACFRDEESANRIAAIRLASHPEVSLLQPASGLLDDGDPQVRRAAILAVGSAPEAISNDDLLRWLHDPDQEVERLCEAALRGRGLQEAQLKLGRLLTDPQPRNRLQVLEYVRHHSELEPGLWLRRLSYDPAAAIRAAAVRTAAEMQLAALSDRLGQMAATDPSPTVRQMAAYYQSCRK